MTGVWRFLNYPCHEIVMSTARTFLDTRTDSPVISLVSAYIQAMVAIATMATTIQASEETRRELFRLVAELEVKLGRKVTYDEAIVMLISHIGGVGEWGKKFRDLFGIAAGERKVRNDVRKLRTEQEKRFARLGKSAR